MDLSARLGGARLYGILDLGYVTEERIESVCGDLLRGGVDVLQLRAKGHAKSQIAAWARTVAPLCHDHDVPFIVNDHVEIAAEVGAGLHLGQDDGALDDARRILGPDSLVGRSTHSVAQARAALEEGADYIGFGPLFPTPTKEGRPGIGTADISEVESSVGVKIPVFCIGGIKRSNLELVLGAGARRVVIVSGLLQAEEIAAHCAEVRSLLAD